MDQLACSYGPCEYPHACDKTDYARVANNMRARIHFLSAHGIHCAVPGVPLSVKR